MNVDIGRLLLIRSEVICQTSFGGEIKELRRKYPNPTKRVQWWSDLLYGGGIDTVPQAGRGRSIRKHMSEVAIADIAHYLHAVHPVTSVGFVLDHIFRHRFRKAGPACTRLEFLT